jgi:hypothetical protein
MFRSKTLYDLSSKVLTIHSQPPSKSEKRQFSPYEKRPCGDILGQRSKVFLCNVMKGSLTDS